MTAALYDENNNLIDTSFGSLLIEDWNESWTGDNINYLRQYRLVLDDNPGFEKFVYFLDVDYSGTVDDCDAYNIDEITFTINDSVHYSGIFDASFTITLEL